MTDQEKEMILKYRDDGLSYSRISKNLGLSISTVKTYCYRHNYQEQALAPVVLDDPADDPAVTHSCEQCGTPINSIPGKKKKRFCSDKCRMLWWRKHSDNLKKKANYNLTCIHCGRSFISYGNKNRKYCSRDCYLEDRFG